VLASRLHWRVLIATILIIMGALYVAPRFLKAPDIDENRVLASRPEAPNSAQEFRRFRKRVDSWIADRFPARPHLIAALNRARMLARVSGSPRVLVGRDGWLFFDNGEHLIATRGPQPDNEVTAQWLARLAARTEYLRARQTPYLVLTPPQQEAVYPEFAPEWHRLNPNRRAAHYARLASQTGLGDVIYLYEPMMAAKAQGLPVYTRHDTHWTGQGAWVGYTVLMRRLKALGVTNEDPRPISAFREMRPGHENKPRNLALMLGVASYVNIRYLELGDPVSEARLSTTWLQGEENWVRPRVIDTGEVGKPVLLMTMDSFSNALLPFLYTHFSRIVLAHNQDGAWREDLIETYDPDVVVLEVVETGIDYAMAPAPAPSADTLARIRRALPSTNPSADATTAPKSAPPPLDLTPLQPALGEQLNAATAAPGCNVEIARIDPEQRTLLVGGWVSELAPENASVEGFARLLGPRGDYVAPVRFDFARPDVRAFYKGPPAYEASGFSGAYQLPPMPSGVYRARVYRRTSGGWIACEAKQNLAVQ
jgi:hypothetical protein